MQFCKSYLCLPVHLMTFSLLFPYSVFCYLFILLIFFYVLYLKAYIIYRYRYIYIYLFIYFLNSVFKTITFISIHCCITSELSPRIRSTHCMTVPYVFLAPLAALVWCLFFSNTCPLTGKIGSII